MVAGKLGKQKARDGPQVRRDKQWNKTKDALQGITDAKKYRTYREGAQTRKTRSILVYQAYLVLVLPFFIAWLYTDR